MRPHCAHHHTLLWTHSKCHWNRTPAMAERGEPLGLPLSTLSQKECKSGSPLAAFEALSFPTVTVVISPLHFLQASDPAHCRTDPTDSRLNQLPRSCCFPKLTEGTFSRCHTSNSPSCRCRTIEQTSKLSFSASTMLLSSSGLQKTQNMLPVNILNTCAELLLQTTLQAAQTFSHL